MVMLTFPFKHFTPRGEFERDRKVRFPDFPALQGAGLIDRVIQLRSAPIGEVTLPADFLAADSRSKCSIGRMYAPGHMASKGGHYGQNRD